MVEAAELFGSALGWAMARIHYIVGVCAILTAVAWGHATGAFRD